MFTGIIEHVVSVKKLLPKAGGGELFLDVNGFYEDLKLGESMAINGVCLTVKEIEGQIISFDVSGETLRRTTLGTLGHAEKVNAERALKVGDRLGGHFVSGHVDGIGTIKEKKQSADQCILSFSTGKIFTDMMIEKGSVAIDGISLTIVGVTDSFFSVALIPYTLASTTLGFRKTGDLVNVEIDMMGKWIKKLLINTREKKVNITQGQLMEQGFL
ncbi:MAG: riboflavin synthase [Candidatus Jettenia sp.]|uniref:Riboflavin synthase n=1 Tax=Candidatus Jettenia caeni TaxID=247490 RepID=I3IQ41_9BACT|nr:riboflavin synthase [Candidatus Jettenia sp. AMX1]MBC6929536.1 riboflavin synthase [Candidatus Jettenia sp.]NUN22928.1 riboflavin synthase [Candidatus Jettenia caeni]KAA0247699.1 MAG: riboflavin synthase [Candidatus Jettenia sp. AMX1]MCE7881159.1 riboflavin synthase [Candidatus Jettenia sp. AMX1]MCQ3927899.1 riboflavin synthase [Candidatus Jettenia sp.]